MSELETMRLKADELLAGALAHRGDLPATLCLLREGEDLVLHPSSEHTLAMATEMLSAGVICIGQPLSSAQVSELRPYVAKLKVQSVIFVSAGTAVNERGGQSRVVMQWAMHPSSGEEMARAVKLTPYGPKFIDLDDEPVVVGIDWIRELVKS